MKKIFIISQEEVVDTVGGAITIFKNFSNMLANNGYEVISACYTSKLGTPELSEKVKFINLKTYFTNQTSYSEAINRYFEIDTPDLIIFFFPHLYIQAHLDKKFNKIPRILMFHSRPDFYFQWETEEDKINLQNNYINTTAQILFSSFYNLLPKYMQESSNIVIGNPVYTQTTIADISKTKKKIIYLSRVDAAKGIEFLINSFYIVAQKYPDWELHIYGQSQPPEYKKVLLKLVKKYNLSKQIKFMGVTSKPIITFLDYDFCVFPSFMEGWGLGLSEALSVGLPAVGLKECSGVNDLIIDGYNGFLCNESYEDFAKKIMTLISDIDCRIQLGKNAINSVKKYNEKIIKDKWLNLINNILNKKIDNIKIENVNSEKQFFPISKIIEMSQDKNPKYKFYQYLFSITNSFNKMHKIIMIMGFKIKIRRNHA